MTDWDLATRDRPLWSAYRVPGWDWNGVDYAPGALIAYDVSRTEGRTCKSHLERHEGRITELWVDPWWGNVEPLPYAEVDTADGTGERVWFHRDHVTTDLGFAIGPVLDGALW